MTILEVLDDEKRRKYKEEKEKRKGETLYHRTTAYNLDLILRSGYLKAATLPSTKKGDSSIKFGVCSARKNIYNRIDAPKEKDSYECDELSSSVGLVEFIIDKDKLISGNIVKGLKKPKPFAEFVDTSNNKSKEFLNILFKDIMKNYDMYYSGVKPRIKPKGIYSILAKADTTRREASTTEASIRFLSKKKDDAAAEKNRLINLANKKKELKSKLSEADKLENYVKDYITRKIKAEVRKYIREHEDVLSKDYYIRNKAEGEFAKYYDKYIERSSILSQFILITDNMAEELNSIRYIKYLLTWELQKIYYSGAGRESEERFMKKDKSNFNIPLDKGALKIRLLKGFNKLLNETTDKYDRKDFIVQVKKYINIFEKNEELNTLLKQED